MSKRKQNAAPTAIGNGVKSNSQALTSYITVAPPAKDFASSVIARRHRLSPVVARLVCELAQIRGVPHG